MASAADLTFRPEGEGAVLPHRLPDQLVWVAQSGSSGGGGGGNRSTVPPRPAEAKGQEAISVPAAPPPEPPVVEPVNIPEASVEPLVVLPAQAVGSAAQFAPGDLSRGAGSQSRGPGGPGVGRENGPGFGPGERGGPGGPDQAITAFWPRGCAGRSIPNTARTPTGVSGWTRRRSRPFGGGNSVRGRDWVSRCPFW